MDQPGFYSGFHCRPSQRLPSPTGMLSSFPASRTGRRERQGRPLLSVLRCEKGHSHLNSPSLSASSKVKLLNSKGRRQCLLQVQRVLACALITTRLLTSPGQLFLWKAGDFPLGFLSSPVSTHRISQAGPRPVCQTWLQRRRARCAKAGSPLCSVAAAECVLLSFYTLCVLPHCSSVFF